MIDDDRLLRTLWARIYKIKTGVIKPFIIDSLARFDSVYFMFYLPHTRGILTQIQWLFQC